MKFNLTLLDKCKTDEDVWSAVQPKTCHHYHKSCHSGTGNDGWGRAKKLKSDNENWCARKIQPMAVAIEKGIREAIDLM